MSNIRRKRSRPPQFETMTESGAHLLRDQIELVWRERGAAVSVRVEPMPWQRTGAVGGWVVRSNLVRGIPPGSEISFPISRSAGHRLDAGKGQWCDASLRETQFAGIKGQKAFADKAILDVPPGEPHSTRRKDQQ